MSYSGLTPDASGRIPRPPKAPLDQRNQQQALGQQQGENKMFSYRYCCFAIPLYNAGIYSILAQFTVCGFVLGVLSFFAPSILAIAIEPGFTIFFGVLCLFVGLVQAVGFYAVYKEKPELFKKYFVVNSGLLSVALLYSLILLIVSSTKHETAIVQCLVQFVSNDEFLDGPSNTSRQVCSIWTYIQLGVCFFVWILFLFSELYFCYMVKLWGKEQAQDHIQYKSILSAVRQSMAASSHHMGLLDEENDWESHSRVGSLDIPSEIGSPRGSRYSNHHGRSGSATLVNGGSRLKNEIEWKEVPGVVQNHPTTTTTQLVEKDAASSSAGTSTSTSRKGKLRETHAQDDQVSHFCNSNNHHHLLASSDSYPIHHQKPGLGNWIEAPDHSPFHDSHSPSNPKPPPVDDDQFYKSPKSS